MLGQSWNFTFSHALLTVVKCYFLLLFIKIFYRLKLHPLRKFPGPKIAAATRLYDFYWDIFLGGRYCQQIDLMHKTYGPIVRIAPDELHINDPSFYNNLYNFEPYIDRPKTTIDNLQNSPNFKLHKSRRKLLDPYFSKGAVARLESVIKANSDKFTESLTKAKASGEPINLSLLSRCFTGDVICEYIFGSSTKFLDDPTKGERFFTDQTPIFKYIRPFSEFKIVYLTLMFLGAAAEKMAKENVSGQIAIIKFAREHVKRAILSSKKTTVTTEEDPLFEQYQHFDLSPTDRIEQRQVDTALLLITAGFETTGFTIETATYHLLATPALAQRLKEELVAAWPEGQPQPPLATLETLPYLKAVIQESIRMSIGVKSRLPRINRKEAVSYAGWIIPKDTMVSMSIQDVNYNADLFPNPARFDPERWLMGEQSVQLYKWVSSFSRGARRCLGMHLAYAELYYAISSMFRHFQLELFKTTRKDIEPTLDWFIPKPETGNGVRIVITM